MFAHPSDFLYFMTNYSFFHDLVAFDTGSNHSRQAYNTAILQQLQLFYGHENVNWNRMDYIRLMKCDLFFTVRFITLVAVILNALPNTDKIRRCQIFLSGDAETRSITQVVRNENGEIDSVASNRVVGIPFMQLYSMILELMNKPFQRT